MPLLHAGLPCTKGQVMLLYCAVLDRTYRTSLTVGTSMYGVDSRTATPNSDASYTARGRPRLGKKHLHVREYDLVHPSTYSSRPPRGGGMVDPGTVCSDSVPGIDTTYHIIYIIRPSRGRDTAVPRWSPGWAGVDGWDLRTGSGWSLVVGRWCRAGLVW